MKNIFKATLMVAVVAAIGMGSYKAYGSYVAANMSEEDFLMAENVLALSDPGNPGWNDKTHKAQPSKKTKQVIVGTSVPQDYTYLSTVTISNVVYIIYEYPCNECVEGKVYAHCWEIPNRC